LFQSSFCCLSGFRLDQPRTWSTKLRKWHSGRDDFVQTYGRELPAVVQCFSDDFDTCIAHLRFPLRHRRVIRTTNLLERLFLEERRRTKMIPNAFGERPVLKLMYAAVIRAAERWRGIAVGEFEQRQLRAIQMEAVGTIPSLPRGCKPPVGGAAPDDAY
jgi:transposase-like protein